MQDKSSANSVYLHLLKKTSSAVITVLSTLLFALTLSSCTKEVENTSPDENVTLLPSTELRYLLDEENQTWHQTNKRICILYGYGYNSKEFIDEMNERLSKLFGSADENGLILSYTFPDDFKRGNRVYITNLSEMLSNVDLQGIILLGAPEGSHIAIARMQDAVGGNLNFPIFSLFPQDDVLGIEDSSDFVLDKAQKAEINGIVTEEEQSYVHEIPNILEKCVRYISYSDAPFEKNARLFDTVKKICGFQKVERYCDPDTGLISINHFVLE